ncbi:MAG: 50S ribosomal protein L17 [Bdellovibrionaceae bacterium]|nr:50S ribosomal protein L17 [Pseudobdellovibrionaceae bacterium]
MHHRRRTKYFGRKFNARKALWRGLVSSLVEHGRIKTTVEKAKELRRHVEKAITLGKKSDGLATRRLLLSRYPNEATVESLLSNVAPRMKDRAGGYTRIIKIGRRPGDTAEMAFIEFVDYDYKTAKGVAPEATETKAKGKKKAAKKSDAQVSEAKAQSKAKKLVAAAKVAKKRNVRKIQAKSRAENRA